MKTGEQYCRLRQTLEVGEAHTACHRLYKPVITVTASRDEGEEVWVRAGHGPVTYRHVPTVFPIPISTGACVTAHRDRQDRTLARHGNDDDRQWQIGFGQRSTQASQIRSNTPQAKSLVILEREQKKETVEPRVAILNLSTVYLIDGLVTRLFSTFVELLVAFTTVKSIFFFSPFASIFWMKKPRTEVWIIISTCLYKRYAGVGAPH